MPQWMPELLREHWLFLVCAYGTVAVVTTMPRPGKDGAPSHWLYTWVWTALRTLIGALPRLVAAFFPQYMKFLPGNGAPGPEAPAAPTNGGTKQ